MPEIQLFIATYNRPHLVLNAIHSALNQNCNSFEIIVSDNSVNDDTEKLVSQIVDKRLSYKKRRPSLPVIDHLNAILQDVTAEYFLIFHDDDLMHPDMLNELYRNIISDRSLLAIGANAKIITQGISPNRVMLKKKYGDLLIRTRDQMVYQYLVKRGIVPFSSYLYRSDVAKKLRFDPENGGKHCDLAFMIDVASMGNVLMLRKPLMDYFISSAQDSSVNEFLHRIKLINYITKTSIYKKNCYLIRRFRIVNLYYEIIQDKRNKHLISCKRRLRILKLIFKVSPFDFFPRSVLHLIK